MQTKKSVRQTITCDTRYNSAGKISALKVREVVGGETYAVLNCDRSYPSKVWFCKATVFGDELTLVKVGTPAVIKTWAENFIVEIAR